MSNKIKLIDDISIGKTYPWDTVAWLGGHIIMALGVLYGFYYDKKDPILWGLLLGIFFIIWALIRLKKQEDRFSHEYSLYLESLDSRLLQKAISSPEIDDKSRAYISNYMNKKHPGWSLNR